MRTLKYRAYIKPLKRYAEKYETILYHHQCNMEPTWTVNISPEEYYGDEELVIEQFTGLSDRNGKEIYEGDIVKAKIQGFWETGPNTICEGKAQWNLEVVYNESRYMDVFHILGSKNAPDRIYYLFEDKLSDIEVIGNIHESNMEELCA